MSDTLRIANGLAAEPPPWQTKRLCVDQVDALSTERCSCGDPSHRQLRIVTRSGQRKKLICLLPGTVAPLVAWLWRSSDIVEAVATLLT
jgi:hypothetical protein